MLDLKFLRSASVYVIGLGKSGLSVVNALLNSGVKVNAWDDKCEQNDLPAHIKKLIVSPNKMDYESLDYIIPSPGVPTTFPEPHDAIAKAKLHKVKLMSDIDLLYNAQHKADYIGITGTNGKSTTTALIHHVINYYNKNATIGGNFGIPVTDFKNNPDFSKDYTNVLELSSFQLDITSDLRCKVAILLNITKDHIDRHGNIENYIEAKKRVFKNQTPEDYAIINIDDPISYEVYKNFEFPSQVIPISVKYPLDYGICVNYLGSKRITYHINGKKGMIDFQEYQNLPGIYNLYNILTTLAVCAIYDIDPGIADSGAIRTFKSLPHRLEFVRDIGNIKFFNDSKSTNAEASFAALSSFENIYWIAGGIAKEGGIEALQPYFKNVVKAYLIGQSAQEFAEYLNQYNIPNVNVQNLTTAVTQAFSDAEQSNKLSYVILSPACASYDQFKNFEDRGEKFKKLVEKL